MLMMFIMVMAVIMLLICNDLILLSISKLWEQLSRNVRLLRLLYEAPIKIMVIICALIAMVMT